MSLVFPSSSVISKLVDQKSYDPKLLVMQKIMPIDSVSFNQSPTAIMWDVLGPATGQTSLSSLDAEPVTINQRVISTKSESPLYFKEEILIPESQLINMRKPGSSVQRAANDIVTNALNQIKTRTITRVESLLGQAMTGSISGLGTTTIDYGFSSAQKPAANGTGYGGYWSTAATCTPIEDLQKAVKILYGSGCSSITLLASNEAMNLFTNSTEVRGVVSTSHIIPGISPDRIAMMIPDLVGCGITEVVVSNQYYKADNGTVTSFLPTNKVFLVGQGPDIQVGCFASTPSLYNGGLEGCIGGPFAFIRDELDTPTPRIRVVGGIYGLPVFYRPDLVVALQVSA